jgi:hypothetical protein
MRLRGCAVLALVCSSACATSDTMRLDDALQLSSRRTGSAVVLELTPRHGARLNALAGPALELADGRVVRWTGARSDSTSDYFNYGASASIADAPRPLRGVLRAVVCPPAARVCEPHAIAVEVR